MTSLALWCYRRRVAVLTGWIVALVGLGLAAPSFGFSGERIVSTIGIGLAIAVLVDAFVVRLTLVPALMTLIGRRNWSYPQWAERLTPRLSIDGPDELGSDEDLDRELASEQPELVEASQGSHGARIRKE